MVSSRKHDCRIIHILLTGFSVNNFIDLIPLTNVFSTVLSKITLKGNLMILIAIMLKTLKNTKHKRKPLLSSQYSSSCGWLVSLFFFFFFFKEWEMPKSKTHQRVCLVPVSGERKRSGEMRMTEVSGALMIPYCKISAWWYSSC